jgi:hypothetical protein
MSRVSIAPYSKDVLNLLAILLDEPEKQFAGGVPLSAMPKAGQLQVALEFARGIVRRRRANTPKRRRDARRALQSHKNLVKRIHRIKPWDFAHIPDEARAEFERCSETVVQLLETLLGRNWGSNEQLAGEFWPKQYEAITGRKATRTRGGAAVGFIEAAMGKLGIEYQEESVIAAMTQADIPTRGRSGRK